jgi:hypothetical protein
MKFYLRHKLTTSFLGFNGWTWNTSAAMVFRSSLDAIEAALRLKMSHLEVVVVFSDSTSQSFDVPFRTAPDPGPV